MIYPTEQNIEILQDSTYEQDYIITQFSKSCTVNDATNVITSPCHKLVADDRVAFSAEDGELPCGIEGGVAYYVIASGLTASAFKVSATSGGSELDFTVLSATALYHFSKVLNLTGYSFDADVRAGYGSTVEASMNCVILDAASGTLRTTLTASQTSGLAQGDYVWDLKLKTSQKSFFYAYGRATVTPTSSRD